ncbi:MAG: DUF2834 domain-containing protein [Chloroflexota bacterium]
MLKNFYALGAILGTVIPWFFFGSFISENGVDIPLFVSSLFANGAAAGFSADVLISALVFWVWSYVDAQRNRVSNWWFVVPATLTVGLSLALPLYLYLREDNAIQNVSA